MARAEHILRVVQMLGVSRAARELECSSSALLRAVHSGEAPERLEEAAAAWLKVNVRTLS